MIHRGSFLEVLYYRLSWMRIELPPLRRRRGDTEYLAQFFLEQEAALQESPSRRFAPAALEILRAYPWPGNVRELRQVVASAVALAEGGAIGPEDLPEFLTAPARVPAGSAENQPPADNERRRILNALQSTAYPGTGRWNLRAAASVKPLFPRRC